MICWFVDFISMKTQVRVLGFHAKQQPAPNCFHQTVSTCTSTSIALLLPLIILMNHCLLFIYMTWTSTFHNRSGSLSLQQLPKWQLSSYAENSSQHHHTWRVEWADSRRGPETWSKLPSRPMMSCYRNTKMRICLHSTPAMIHHQKQAWQLEQQLIQTERSADVHNHLFSCTIHRYVWAAEYSASNA